MYALFLCLSIAGISVATWYTASRVRAFYFGHIESSLLATATHVESLLEKEPLESEVSNIQALCEQYAALANVRLTIIHADGSIIAETNGGAAETERLVDTPEVVEALSGRNGATYRFSNSLGEYRYYVAVPMVRKGQVQAVVRASVPIDVNGRSLTTLYMQIVLGTGIIAILITLVSLLVTGRLNRPFRLIKSGAERLAQGQLGTRLPVPESRELAEVVVAMNKLAAELERRIGIALEQRNELEAVLGSMIEGVIAVDNNGHIININRAARELFNVEANQVVGQSIEVAIRHAELQEFVRKTLDCETYVEGEIVVYHEGQKYLQAHGTRLRDAQGRGSGGVIALNDVTRLRTLEPSRREFVANVSHELRTPITAIKGYVETLLDGAIDNADDAKQFLGIVARQANRLNTLIEDLLTLSRVEQEAETGDITMERGSVREVVEGAILLCENQAENKNVPLHFECSGTPYANINGPLLQQAVVNLIENAVKYSEAGTPVDVVLSQVDDFVQIDVIDRGCGIAQDHLPRLFERFYRVDQARSRKLGGTGLGLAIVKHIVRVHGGSAFAKSKLGEGSVFSIRIPCILASGSPAQVIAS